MDASALAPLQPSGPPPSVAGAVGRLGGVIRLFLASLCLWILGVVAIKVGAPEAKVDVAMSSVFALIAIGCTIAVYPEIAPAMRSTGGWRGGLTALVGFGILIVFGSVYFRIVRWLGFPMIRISDQYLELGWSPWTAYVLVSLAPGVFEELTFRGYVMARLDGVLTPCETLVVQAALFSVLHLGVVIFPSHFGLGLLLGALRRRTGSLYPGMAVHTAWNATVIGAELAGINFP